MKQAFTRWVMAASVAASVGLAQPGAAGAATTFVDAAAWQAAISGLKLPKAQTMPAIDPHRIIMSDSFGSWTQANQETATATVMVEGADEVRRRDRFLLSDHGVDYGVRSSDGLLYAGFGCYSAIYPCFGLQVVEIQLKRPIQGFAGLLTYGFGYPEFYYSWEAGNTTSSPYISFFEGLETKRIDRELGAALYSFNGFYGVLFDRPTTNLRFSWFEDSAPDNGVSFRFNDMVMIGVPEPGLVASFALAVLLLLAAAQRAPQASLWRRRRVIR